VVAVVGIMLGLSFFLGQRINRQYKKLPLNQELFPWAVLSFAFQCTFT